MPDADVQRYFFDTSALHRLCNYLASAQTHGLAPFGPTANLVELENALSNDLGMTDEVVLHHIEGARLYGHLQALSERGEANSFYMSRFTPYTLKADYSKQIAHYAMLRAGIEVPSAIGTVSNLALMRNYLTPEQLQATVSTVDNVLKRVETMLYLPPQYAESQAPASNSEIMQIISLLQDNVLMDMLDVWTYACATAIGATRLVSFNQELVRFTNYMVTPPDAYWKHLRQLLEDYWDLNLAGYSTSELGSIFPQAYNPEADRIFYEGDGA